MPGHGGAAALGTKARAATLGARCGCPGADPMPDHEGAVVLGKEARGVGSPAAAARPPGR